jgi:hypothetical protein
MPLMNTTLLRDARVNKWFPGLFAGEGIRNWQIGLAVLVFVIMAVVLWFLIGIIGVGFALVSAWVSAMVTG